MSPFNKVVNLPTTNIIASKAGPSVTSFLFFIKVSISSGSLMTSSVKIFKKVSAYPSNFRFGNVSLPESILKKVCYPEQVMLLIIN